MRTVAVRFPIAKGVPVVYRYGHFGGVAGLIGDDYFLFAVRRRENKAAVFVKRDRRAVYGNGINMLFINHNSLRFAVGLAVFYAADDRLNIVKRYSVGAKICYVHALVNEHYINNIFTVGLY